MNYFLTPRGNLVSATIMPKLDLSRCAITYEAVTEYFATSANAQSFYNYLIAQIAGSTSTNLAFKIPENTITFTSITPNPFFYPGEFILSGDCTTGCLSKDNVKEVHIEDSIGGQDDNGAVYSAHFIDEMTLKCYWAGDGDGPALPGSGITSLIIYSKGKDGNKSNSLAASFDNVNKISIP